MDKNILYRFFDEKATLEEEKGVKRWMEESVENYNLFFEERKLFDSMILLADEKELFFNDSQPIFNRLWIRKAFQAAAVVAITLISTLTYQELMGRDELAMQKITTPSGQRINLELPDGTMVWLNSRTTIQYPATFADKKRVVKIDGEAYFEVAHDRKKPFIVETDKGNIEVFGTKFDVEAYSDNDSFVTSLMEGSVKVISDGQELFLEPEQMSYIHNGRLKVTPIEDHNAYRWREGLICFREETFTNIMAKFEKCYGVVIKIRNSSISKDKYTGKFRQADGIVYALRVLQQDLKFQFERDEENHIIYIK